VIFSEGKNTEPNYFTALEASREDVDFLLEIKPNQGQGANIAKRARQYSKSEKQKNSSSYTENDSIWVVFDRDTTDFAIVKESLEICAANKIGVALSDPCFEVWLIQHFRDFDSPIDHHAVQRELKNVSPSYEKDGSKIVEFDLIGTNIKEACSRAKKQISQRSTESNRELIRPFTTVYLLVEELIEDYAPERIGESARLVLNKAT
jgi:RloB-like protein